MKELRTTFPVWIELSGLPEHLNKEISPAAWSLFKKICEYECAANLNPGTVDISLSDLAGRTGIEPTDARQVIIKMRDAGILSCFLPEHEEEKGLFSISVPIKTPKQPGIIKKEYPELFVPGNDFLRYHDSPIEESNENDPEFQHILNMYFNTIGLKINTFILDELRLIRNRFPLDKIEKTFNRAKHLNAPSLNWVTKELFRICGNDEKSS